MKEKNIEVFSTDAKSKGSYLYTSDNKLSLRLATKRQSDEIFRILNKQVNSKTNILDIGCGDGTYTIELYRALKPKYILGIDPSPGAIASAVSKTPIRFKNKVDYRLVNVYQVDKMYSKNQFDVVVIRGVLHHLYNPAKAIKKISNIADKILILEPNGYNPLLKVIEKVSPYHRLHEEKSYWPPKLDVWFSSADYVVRNKKFFSIIPYFFPDSLTKIFKIVEPYLEMIPVIHKIYCGSLLIFYEKKKLE